MKHVDISSAYTAVKHLGLPGELRSPLTDAGGEEREKFLLKHVRVVIALNVASIALALLLFAGLFLSWSSNSDLNRLKGELEGLHQFEKRILARMDAMNNGVQHRLSKMDQRMGAIQSDLGLVTKGRRDPTAAVESIATMIRNDGGYFGTATTELLLSPELLLQNTQRFVPSYLAPNLSLSHEGPAEGEVSIFRRVTTEDGKVRYEMKR